MYTYTLYTPRWWRETADSHSAPQARDPASALNVRPDSVSVGGISAGGQISLVLQHMARDAGVPLRLCMASVPATVDVLGYTSYTESPYPSFHEFAHSPV